MNKTKESWNKIAAKYDSIFTGLDIYNESYEFVLSRLSDEAKILDLGCGPANISKYFSEVRPDLKISGIDYSTAMLEIARRNVPNGKFYNNDIVNVNCFNEKYDAVLCGFAIPYIAINRLIKMFQNLHQVTSSKSILYLSYVEGDEYTSKKISDSDGNEMLFYYYNMDQLAQILNTNEWKPMWKSKVMYHRSSGIQEEHQIIVAEKS